MAKLCQTDYETVRPTEYFPETFRVGTCDACGEETFVARVRQDEVEDAKLVRYRDPRDRYGSLEHEAWLMEMERQED